MTECMTPFSVSMEIAGYGIMQPLAAEIAWTKNTLILDRPQNPLQREFYLRAGILLGPSSNQAESNLNR